VAINIAPINPTTQSKIPSMEKAKTIKMDPMMKRKIASILPTFFVLTTGSIFCSSLDHLERKLKEHLERLSKSVPFIFGNPIITISKTITAAI
jgi:hypothetical protein